jgi:hypothetical protein
MRTPTGLVAHVLLSVLILLSAGAIVLSLETAPPVAQSQLRVAAQNTRGASSFVVDYVETVSSPVRSSALGGKKSQSSRIRILYEAPDRIVEHVNEDGLATTVVVVGNRRYERVGSAAWKASTLTPSARVSVGLEVARDLLLPLQSASSASSVTKVTNTSSTYAYLPSNLVELLDSLFGTDAADLSSVRFFATINGEFIGSQLVVGSHSPYRFAVALHFSSVNSVPPITAPVT